MTPVSYLTLMAAALIGMAGTPALAQHQATGRTTAAKAPVKQAAKNQPSKAATRSTKHQATCRSRYKSYDVKSDSYLYRGKKVRCTL